MGFPPTLKLTQSYIIPVFWSMSKRFIASLTKEVIEILSMEFGLGCNEP